MILSSERLHLIEFKEELIDNRVISWFDNPDLMKYYTNSKKKITKDILVKAVENGIKNKNNYSFFVVHTESRNLIGTLKIGPINNAHRISDLVALIGETGDYGKGIGTEAIQLGIRLAFEKFELRKLFGGMYASNISSIKAYTRAGWIVEGILKGHYFNNEKNEDRILVGCFNPKFFDENYIEEAKFEDWYNKIY